MFRANLQHPPLLKEIAGLSMLLGGIRWPRSDATAAYLRGEAGTERWEWPIGEAILASNGPDRVLRWARLPFPLIAALLVP